jgi:hypothetical protein
VDYLTHGRMWIVLTILPKIAGNFSFSCPVFVTGIHNLAARRAESFKVIQTQACVCISYILIYFCRVQCVVLQHFTHDMIDDMIDVSRRVLNKLYN